MGDEQGWLPGDRRKVRLSALQPPREIAARLEESETARRELEARILELERENAELRARIPDGGGDGGQVERLRQELSAAHEIIRAIEAAYIAGENCER